MSYKDRNLIVFNETSSLDMEPCIGVCTLTYLPHKRCQGCGLSYEDMYGDDKKEIKSWIKKTDVEKKLAVIDAWTEGYFPRQRLEYIAEKKNISLNQARKIIQEEMMKNAKQVI
tara:strand:+ start:548 stop:889 length:342 start_codon:yes stop_codon:yes gene_type:complete